MGSVFQAAAKSLYSTAVSFVRQLIFLLPAALVLAIIGQNSGNHNLVWWCYPIAEIGSLAITGVCFGLLKRNILDKLPEHGEISEENA